MTHPRITNTSTVAAKHIKVLVHGPSGAGKTRLCATTGGKPLIISAESGLLSLREFNLDVWEIKKFDDLKEVFTFLQTDTTYDWVCLDSISEVAEVVLAAEKALTKDPRKAYGEMQERMVALIRAFRDLPKNVYMAAKQGKTKDEMTGAVIYGPSAPGQKIAEALPYFFDEVFALHSWKDDEGNFQSALQTRRDAQYEAKDRSGALAPAEPADLGAIHAKILSTVTNQETTNG
jgi:phage nucleotide-binding protein